MGYNVNLKVYEGPMELLLDLIKKNEIDIYDIPIHLLTSEFLDYIETAKSLNLELTSDFALMASTLLEIKSRMLLPKFVEDESEEEVEDPRDELVQKILEYEKFRELSQILKESAEYEEKAFYKLQEDFSGVESIEFVKNCDLNSLVKAFKNVVKNAKVETKYVEYDTFPTKIAEDNMNKKLTRKKNFMFTELLSENYSNSEVVSYFLVVLEYIKISKIYAVQNEMYTDISITRREHE